MIVLMAGLPGTGKTTLARELVRRAQGALLSKDEIRAALFAPADSTQNRSGQNDSPQNDIEYSVNQDDFVMEIMLQAALFLLHKDPARKVFLDGRTFSRCYQIERVLNFADELAQPVRIIECTCTDQSARQRLEFNPDPSHPARNRTFALYLEVKSRFEPIVRPKTTINTDAPIENCVQQALALL
jgi:adenylylsulfate kinase